MILIKYADPPTIVIFSIGETIYTLRYDSKDRFPYSISEGMGSTTKLINVNEWLGLRTRGRYNLETLHDLANSFIVGRDSAYTQGDVLRCARKAFEMTRDILFKDGLAGRYAELFDIECMSLDEIRKRLRKAQSMNMSNDRIRRFRRVCEKNGWADLAHAWGRILSDSEPAKNDVRVMSSVDDTIKRSIERMVVLAFTKERDYLSTLAVIDDGETRRV